MSYKQWALVFRVHAIGCIAISGICGSRGDRGYAVAFLVIAAAVHELALCATRYAREQKQ